MNAYIRKRNLRMFPFGYVCFCRNLRICQLKYQTQTERQHILNRAISHGFERSTSCEKCWMQKIDRPIFTIDYSHFNLVDHVHMIDTFHLTSFHSRIARNQSSTILLRDMGRILSTRRETFCFALLEFT